MYVFNIHGSIVMLDYELARSFGIKTGQMNRIVKRNPERFPPDFCFRLTREEFSQLICQDGIRPIEDLSTAIPENPCQFGISVLRDPSAPVPTWRERYPYSQNYGGRRKPPMVYTNPGAFMLASLIKKGPGAEKCVDLIAARMK